MGDLKHLVTREPGAMEIIPKVLVSIPAVTLWILSTSTQNNDSLLEVSLLNYKVELIIPIPSLKLEMKHRQVIPKVS